MISPDVQETLSGLERNIEARFQATSAPGLIIGVVLDGELVWSHGYGRANDGSDRPPDAHTIARVASITKTFTGTAILQLRDDGLLSLDDPLVLHIPEFSTVRATAGRVEDVTIRRILTHRSGLTTETPLPTWAEPVFPSMDAMLAALPETEIVITPDSAWKYSNLGFSLLGEVVARLSGTPYVDYVHSEILEPLEMSSTAFDLTSELRARFYTGHDPAQNGAAPAPAAYAHLNGMTAAGQLHSCVSDLAKWAAFQLREDGGERGGSQVLRGPSLAEMHRPQFVEPDWSAGQCLVWRATRVANRVYHNHGGGIHGFSSELALNLPHKTAVITLINAWPLRDVGSIAQDIIEAVTRAVEAATPESAPPAEEPAPAQLAPYVGLYLANPATPARIAYAGGTLRLRPPWPEGRALHAPATLEPTGDPSALLVLGARGSGERALFEFSPDGPASAFTLGGFRYLRQTHSEA